MHLLLLCGASGAGKDTIADALVPHGPARIALGDRLRELLRETLPIGRRDLTIDADRPIAHLGQLTGRGIMRLVAGMLREVDPNVWLRPAIDRLHDLYAEDFRGLAVVTDIRDPREMRALSDWATCRGIPTYRVRVSRQAQVRSTDPYESLAARCVVDTVISIREGGHEEAAADFARSLSQRWPGALPAPGREE